MAHEFFVDGRLIGISLQQENILAFGGRTAEGTPIMIMVAAGANAGLLKSSVVPVLPWTSDLTFTGSVLEVASTE